MNFNEQQRKAIFGEKPLVVISASAGSGKTRVLTERYVHLCELRLAELVEKKRSAMSADVSEIVAITFTEKAAREMKERIRTRMNEQIILAKEEQHEHMPLIVDFWKQQIEALDQAPISTIHSFCHQLLHEFSLQAGIPPNFSVIDEREAKLLKQEVFHELFMDYSLLERSQQLLQFFDKRRIQEAIEAIYEEVHEVEASVELRSYFHVDTLLSLQLKQVDAEKKELISQFHERAIELVKQLPNPEFVKGATAKHIANLVSCFESLTEQLQPDDYYEQLQEAMPKRVSKDWEQNAPALFVLYEQLFKPLKDQWKTFEPIKSEDVEQIKLLFEQFVALFVRFDELYKEKKKARLLLDFNDLQQQAITLLQNKYVQQFCREKYKHMMLDEFQDTNKLQMKMITLIRPAYRFVVGDRKQSIYRFRGADVRLMKELEEEATARKETSELIQMNTNYRTAETIIQFVNELFSVVIDDYVAIESGREGVASERVKVELLLAEDETEDEFCLLAQRIVAMIRSKTPFVERNKKAVAPSWGDVAILLQSRTHLASLERALQEHEVPYTVYGGIGFFERHEVIDFLTLLEWLSRPWEEVYLFALLRGPLFGFTFEDLLLLQKDRRETSFAQYIEQKLYQKGSLEKRLQKRLEKLYEWQKKWLPPFHFHGDLEAGLYELYEESGLKIAYLSEENGWQKTKNIEKLIDMIVQLKVVSLDECLEKLALIKPLSDKEGEAEIEQIESDTVHIMTVHAAKGLEFPIVCLADMTRRRQIDRGAIRFDEQARLVMTYELDDEQRPLDKAKVKMSPAYRVAKRRADGEATEEAKRLFYVAVTRAKDYLVMVGKKKSVKHSWLEMLELAVESNPSLAETFTEIRVVDEQETVTETEKVYVAPQQLLETEVVMSFSVSEVMTFIHDPIQYYERYVLRLPESFQTKRRGEVVNDSINDIDARELGTYVHRACELIDNGFLKEEALDEVMFLLDEFEAKRYRPEVEKLIQSYDDIKNAELGERVANEWPFVMKLSGAEIVGEIDKIVRDDDGIHIIDFKTNRGHPRMLLAHYKPQLYLYKMAYEQVTKERVAMLSLYLFRDNKQPLHTLELTENYEVFLQKKVQEMIELKRKSAPRSAYEALARQ